MSETNKAPRETGCRCFAPNSDETAAQGHFGHGSVDRATRRPVVLPEGFLSALTGSMRDHPTA